MEQAEGLEQRLAESRRDIEHAQQQLDETVRKTSKDNLTDIGRKMLFGSALAAGATALSDRIGLPIWPGISVGIVYGLFQASLAYWDALRYWKGQPKYYDTVQLRKEEVIVNLSGVRLSYALHSMPSEWYLQEVEEWHARASAKIGEKLVQLYVQEHYLHNHKSGRLVASRFAADIRLFQREKAHSRLILAGLNYGKLLFTRAESKLGRKAYEAIDETAYRTGQLVQQQEKMRILLQEHCNIIRTGAPAGL